MVTKFALIFLLFFNSLIVNATECKDFVGIFDIKINISMNDENGKGIKEVKNAHIDIVDDNLFVLKPKNVFSTNDEQVIGTCNDLVKNIKLNSDNSGYKMKYEDFV